MGLGITAPTYYVGSQDQICSTVVAARTFLLALYESRILNPVNAKATIRNSVLSARDALSTEQRIEKSLQATQSSFEKIIFEPGTIISAFFPIRSEIDPRPLMDALRKSGAVLCLPIVVDTTTIIFRELVRDAQLVDTGFGTRGPAPNAKILDPQILLMPLAAFDSNGGRIGYGAGHYDRAIAKLIAKGNTPRLIGMAFDCQYHEFVPQESHDIAMDAIVTESGYRDLNEKGSQ